MRRIHEILLTLLIFYMGIPAWGYCKNEPLYHPFWTDSLLSRSGKVVGPGHYNIEPYFFDEEFYSLYDKHWNLHMCFNALSLALAKSVSRASTLLEVLEPMALYIWEISLKQF